MTLIKKKQVLKNLVSNIFIFFINIVVGLSILPYLIKTLGTSTYGIIPLVVTVTSYMTIVTASLNTSYSRYLLIELENGNVGSANKTFNTSLILTFVGLLISIPILIIVIYHLPQFLNLPNGQNEETIILFIFVVITFYISTLTGNFSITLFALNRLDLQNILQLVSVLVQNSFIVIFFSFFSPQLRYVGASYLIGSIAAFLGSYILWKRLSPELMIDPHYFDISRLRDLTSLGGWVAFSQIGTILFLQIDLIVVNKLFGAEAVGEYALAMQWSIILRTAAIAVSGIMTPIIMSYYANDNLNKIEALSKSAIRYMGFLMALPIGLTCGFSSQLLSLWIDPSFSHLAPLIWILNGNLIINLTVLPLFSINTALNKAKIPAIITCIMGIANLILAILLPLITGWGYYGVAIAGAIMLTMKNALFTPLYAANILGVDKKSFILPIIPGIGLCIAIIIASNIVEFFVNISNWLELILSSIIIGAAYLIALWYVFIKDEERNKILQMIAIRHHGDKLAWLLK